MFSELPILFERNFAMAFFMPVAIFIGASLLTYKTTAYGSESHAKVRP